jgi:flagellar protein FlaG
MSVELTGKAMDILPVKPQQSQRQESQPIKDGVESKLNVENKLTGVKTPEDTNNVNQLNKKDEVNQVTKKDEKESMTTPQLEKVAKQLQEFIGKMNRGLEFTVDEDSGRDVIKVIDKNSGDIIKQYPSEEVLSLVAKLSEATGNFIDSKI